ncbi:receptor-interacting serine/threonine-protein kinase 3-like [Pelodytes ibericus]
MLPLPPSDLDQLVLIGSGGFGLVYKGWSRTLRMQVALKMIQGSNPNLMKEIQKEIDVMLKASNPHVLRLLGVYEKRQGDLAEHGLVMEYMPHGSLRTLFQYVPDVPLALRFRILHQVVLGMNYLHSLDPPIIHRDLKPANVLLNKYLDVQITDFGLAKIVGLTTSAQPSFAGTLSYMPPEALSDIHYKPTKAFDVYSFGILMWSVFSGEEPYGGVQQLLLTHFVTKGQRPLEDVLDEWGDSKMVPEAKTLMVSCWSGNVEERPSFGDCSDATCKMVQEYEDQIENDVRIVLEGLKRMYSFDENKEENPSHSFSSFLRDWENPERKDDESQKSVLENNQVELHEEPVCNEKESAVSPKEGSSAEALLRILRQSGDYKKIVGGLHNDGVISTEHQDKLANSDSLPKFGEALRETLKSNPQMLMQNMLCGSWAPCLSSGPKGEQLDITVYIWTFPRTCGGKECDIYQCGKAPDILLIDAGGNDLKAMRRDIGIIQEWVPTVENPFPQYWSFYITFNVFIVLWNFWRLGESLCQKPASPSFL